MRYRSLILGRIMAASILVAAAADAQDQLYHLEARSAQSPAIAGVSITVSPELQRRLGTMLSIELPLPDGRLVSAWRIGHRVRSNGLVWRGRTVDSSVVEGSVTLTMHRGLLSGALFTDGEAWTIEPGSDGAHLLRRIAADAFPECGVDSPLLATRTPAAPQYDELPNPILRGDPFPQIDILVVYTASALAGAGGVAQIEALILNAADLTNTAFQNSDVFAQVNVVHMAELDMSGYGTINDLHDALLAMLADTDLAALRDTWSADLVAAIFESGGGLCGYAKAMDEVGPAFADMAYSISVRECAVANLTFAHEIGHNLGCHHNPKSTTRTPEEASFPWSFGHYVPGNFRTVMAFASFCGPGGCLRLPSFSNPEISLRATVLHAPEPSGIDDQRDNHRTLNSTATVAAAFRSASLIFMDGFESGNLSAWSPTR